MSPDTLNPNQPNSLLDKLLDVLEKQEKMIRNNDFRGVQKLCEQAGPIIAELAVNPFSQCPQTKERCEQLIEQYKKLQLMIETEKDSTYRNLRKIGTGKKTIQAYQNKI